MGRSRSHEFMEYQGEIMSGLIKNKRIVELLNPEEYRTKNKTIFPGDLPYKYIFPYELIQGTLTEKNRYLGYEISATPNTYNPSYKDMNLDFFVICDENLIKYPDPDISGRDRRWYDLVVCELDEMFLGENPIDIGVGKFQFVSNEPYFVSYAREIPFKGRTWSIKVEEWMDGKTFGR